VNDSDLACIRALYRFGIANKLVTSSPATGVKVSAKAKAGTSKLPYTDAENAKLLQAAERETLAYRRWLPLLLVTTGARVGEMAQLSGDRVRTVDGVPCLVIEPASDGGSLKNATSERTIPMHPALIQSGFLDFVKGRGDGPLFYGRAKGSSARHASVGPRNHLSSWIRCLPGFDDDRKSPAHATRHWWKSVASRIGMPDSVADHIQGHAAASVAGRYRHFAVDRLAEEVAKMPVPAVNDRSTVALITAEAVSAASAVK
jgi:integrase